MTLLAPPEFLFHMSEFFSSTIDWNYYTPGYESESYFISYVYFTIKISLYFSELSWTEHYGVMVIVVGNGHGDTSSNPGRDWLHFT